MIKASYCKVKSIVTIKISKGIFNDLVDETSDGEFEIINDIIDECGLAIDHTLNPIPTDPYEEDDSDLLDFINNSSHNNLRPYPAATSYNRE